jgi:hypothetical protein
MERRERAVDEYIKRKFRPEAFNQPPKQTNPKFGLCFNPEFYCF